MLNNLNQMKVGINAQKAGWQHDQDVLTVSLNAIKVGLEPAKAAVVAAKAAVDAYLRDHTPLPNDPAFNKLKSTLDVATGTLAGITSSIQRVENLIANLQQRIDYCNKAIDGIEKQITAINARIAAIGLAVTNGDDSGTGPVFTIPIYTAPDPNWQNPMPVVPVTPPSNNAP